VRASKRQAAPFSRGTRKPNPNPPGRKAGKAYGEHRRKTIPEQVDQIIAVPVPSQCPYCGAAVQVDRTEPQYQQEIVRQTIWRRFDIPICHCVVCEQRVQGRHPLQTSDALGAAAVQLGPQALALAVQLNKAVGLPHADVATVLEQGYGLQVHRSTICRAVTRMAQRGEATWNALREAARRSPVNAVDETGWRVDAQLRWLWAVVNQQISFCDILPGRGFQQAAALLGEDYDGFLTHDGWAVYYRFLHALHQSCNGHLIRRCREMAEIANPSAARFPRQVQNILEQGLRIRDRYRDGQISWHGLLTAAGRLETQLDRLLARCYRHPANRRFAKHLRHERPYLFTYLYCPGLDATNNVVERMLRFLVVVRKNWGGNRTEQGARAQAVLTSILATAKQQGRNPIDLLVQLLVSPRHKILDIVPAEPTPRDQCSHSPPMTAPEARLITSPAPATYAHFA
jgi:transposase